MICALRAGGFFHAPGLLVALIAVLSVWPREARTSPCKPDGESCRTNQSCCGRVCVDSAPPGKRPRGTCCTPTTCAVAGADCGFIDNGSCPDRRFCGTCTSPETCGGGGTPNVCGVTTTTTSTTTTTTFPSFLTFPPQVTGTGTSGSLSWSVSFGYSGAFELAVHGLVPASTTAATVVDDPADDINVARASGVGVNTFTIPVSVGVRNLRTSLFDAENDGATDNLDLYLFDHDLNLIGSSTGATAEEEIDVPVPAEGNWTVVVHGFETDGPDTNYTLFVWVLLDFDAGNMLVTDPGDATAGTTATVSVTWSGLTSGTRYLGSVGYNDGVDVFGETLVAIKP